MDKYLQRRSPARPSTTHSESLASVAKETEAILPYLLLKRPDAPPKGILYDSMTDLQTLAHNRCPNLSTRISVINADTIDAALSLPRSSVDLKPILVLNMANAVHGGGGWLNGALAQEESMCYRSSLSFTLKRDFYPMKSTEAIYSPTVLVIRENLKQGHGLLDLNHPERMRVVSVVSVAAVRDPALVTSATGEKVYRHGQVRWIMKDKIRTILRIAGREKCRRIVLGSLGCGAFGHPNREVAKMYREVLEDREFRGWFESVVFAVLDDHVNSESNFSVFKSMLEGMPI